MELTTLDCINPQELKILSWLEANKLTNMFSDFISRSDAYSRLISGIVGWQWEDEFRTLCELRGFVCEHAPLGQRYDLMVNSYKVQCKSSFATCSIDIRNKDKENNRRYLPGDFDFMAIYSNEEVYVVPISSLLDDTLTKTRASARIDFLQPFKDNFGVFNANI